MGEEPLATPGQAGQWVLLAYRMPSRPSAPRIAVWRKLDRLGVARLGDGLVALPADARTREQLDWIAEEIVTGEGTATVWLAVPGSLVQERAIAEQMQADRRVEYRKVIVAAHAAQTARPGERSRAAGRLRAELRRIARRDFFPPAERDAAHQAVRALTEPEQAPGPADEDRVSAPASATGQTAASRKGKTR
ncbi:hypothetical protein Misp01_19450 [Microtetraspora sp. NBRC 13810]|uniref:Chromate resistance protein ChrB n=1 Tax=Microtetraspora sp. NBRC 13810 TaxID=3030990 RepID=UPI0024A0F158|nr:Chromate resistance protein ChrB [Microtetraspora sp. NBRC 13810]GLW06815.1 hypothetical protein Misp01_19450 [Microtetraspora sp. NBRC 13810]